MSKEQVKWRFLRKSRKMAEFFAKKGLKCGVLCYIIDMKIKCLRVNPDRRNRGIIMKKEATVTNENVAIKTTSQPEEVKPEVKSELDKLAATGTQKKRGRKSNAEKEALAAEGVSSETVKTPAKKTAAKKTAAKKSAAKKPVEKKTNLIIQYYGKEITQEEIIEKVKQAYTADTGKKAVGIKELNIYVKPEENAAYYVINSKAAGRVDL